MSSTFIPIESIGRRPESLAQTMLPAESYDIPVLAEVENGDFMPRRLMVVTRYDCVYSCDHCFFHSNPKSTTRMTEEDIQRSVDLGVYAGVEDVMFSGGETMIDPELTTRSVEYANAKGLEALVQTSYLGDDSSEVAANAARLKEAGLDTLISTISIYHRDSMPSSIQMSYTEYMAMFIDEVTKAGIGMQFKLPWDLDQVGEAEELFRDMMMDLIGRTDVYNIGRMVEGLGIIPDIAEYYSLNGQNALFLPAPIISVGKARPSGLKTEDWDKSLLYRCPIQHDDDHTEGMLTVYPDGNIARCCSAEKGADFGFGKLGDDPADILLKVEHSAFVSANTDRILALAHQVLEKEFPHLLPAGGPKQACEVCSPLVSHDGPKRRVAELLGRPDLFQPAVTD